MNWGLHLESEVWSLPEDQCCYSNSFNVAFIPEVKVLAMSRICFVIGSDALYLLLSFYKNMDDKINPFSFAVKKTSWSMMESGTCTPKATISLQVFCIKYGHLMGIKFCLSRKEPRELSFFVSLPNDYNWLVLESVFSFIFHIGIHISCIW